MKQVLTLSILIAASLFTLGQEAACSLTYHHMSGTLGRDSLVADLVIHNGDITGSCTFTGLRHDEGELEGMAVTQRLEGKIDEHGVATVSAWEQHVETAEYSGMIGEGFSGTYRGISGHNVRSFSLSEDYRGSIPLSGYCMEKDSALLDTAGSPRARIKLSLLLPEDKPEWGPIREAILKAFFGQPVQGKVDDDSLLTAFSNDYFGKYIESNIDIYEGGHSFNWEMTGSSYVNMNRCGMLVYRADNYAFTGGAHGLGISRFLVFDTEALKKLELQDIFIEGYEEALSKLIESSFRHDHFLEPGQPLTEAGLFEEHIAPTGNFFITENSIGFFYNPYEIAPYAMGGITISLQPQAFGHLLRHDGIVWKLWADRLAP
jgi:hypothetical protein